MFTSVTHAVETFPVSIPSDYSDKKLMEQKKDPQQNALTLSVHSEMYTTIACKKSWIRTNNSSSTLRRMGNRVFKVAMDTLNPHLLIKKSNLVFGSLKCAAKLNVAFGFVLRKVENDSCRYYYPHENITMMERSKLVARKKIWKKTEILLNNVDVIDSCTKERSNTMWKLYNLTNATFFAALLKEVPMRCQNAFCQNHLSKIIPSIF